MDDKNNMIETKNQNIQLKIFTIRNQQVMLDRDLADLYDVQNKRLNEQVKRNVDRFPQKFRFQLNQQEKNELVANCDHLKSLKHSATLPHVFAEQGISMLSAVLRSATAIKMSIQIMDAFVNMRKFLSNFAQDLKKHNQQYSPITVKKFTKAHDRFLIIDDTSVYHFGASIKDLGKKWFAFSKMEIDAKEILNKLEKK